MAIFGRSNNYIHCSTVPWVLRFKHLFRHSYPDIIL